MTPLGAFLGGLGAFPRALRLIARNPRLLLYAVVPMILTALLLAGVGWAAVYAYKYILSTQIAGESWWRSLLQWAGYLVLVPAVIVVAYLVFAHAGTVVAIPFNDALSGRAEAAYIRSLEPNTLELAEGSAAGESFLRGTIRAAIDSIRLTSVAIAAQLVMLPMLLVPVAGAALYLAVVSYFTGIEYFDLILSRHGFTWAEKKSIIRDNRLRVFGLGAGTTLCSFIPFTLLFVLPLSAIGGTLVYLDLVRAGRIGEVAGCGLRVAGLGMRDSDECGPRTGAPGP